MKTSRVKSLPSGRVARLSHFGGLVSNILANMAIDGVKQIGRGNVPALKDLLLTTKNISHLSERLARLRGAAMKMGQLLSMDSGDLLPPELQQLLVMLRDNAYILPEDQLHAALEHSFGKDWKVLFEQFDSTPFAAASIGQVHKAQGLDGTPLAVKIQYPGVAKSIHSDVDNMGTLMKMSGQVPAGIDLTRLLLEVKMQLIREADYNIEQNYLQRYAELLRDDLCFVIPGLKPELCNEHVLTMTFEQGENIESLATLSEPHKNLFCCNLIRLMFRELFEFRLMQTDPNFANYLLRAEKQQIVLLDFGATRGIEEELSLTYKTLAKAILNDDMEQVLDIAIALGFYHGSLPEAFRQEVLLTLKIGAEPIQYQGEYDFADSDVVQRLKDRAMTHLRFKEHLGTATGDAIFIHRKLLGMHLLLCKVGAKVNLRGILEEFL